MGVEYKFFNVVSEIIHFSISTHTQPAGFKLSVVATRIFLHFSYSKFSAAHRIRLWIDNLISLRRNCCSCGFLYTRRFTSHVDVDVDVDGYLSFFFFFFFFGAMCYILYTINNTFLTSSSSSLSCTQLVNLTFYSARLDRELRVESCDIRVYKICKICVLKVMRKGDEMR